MQCHSTNSKAFDNDTLVPEFKILFSHAEQQLRNQPGFAKMNRNLWSRLTFQYNDTVCRTAKSGTAAFCQNMKLLLHNRNICLCWLQNYLGQFLRSQYQENSFYELNSETILIYTSTMMTTSRCSLFPVNTTKVLGFVAFEVITVLAGKWQNISICFSVFSVS